MPEPGHEVRVEWRGRTVAAWVPDPIAERDLTVSVGVARRTEQALAAVARGHDRVPTMLEPLARLVLRAEGVASSNVEGLRRPLAAIAAAEADPNGTDEEAAWIAGNLATVTDALAHAQTSGPITTTQLHTWHRRLMEHSRLPSELIGASRTTPGWIGGTSPLDAAYIPPPSDQIGRLIDDLVEFMARTDLDPITQAAVTHAQFETIHPYGDGNGRIGRVLIGWVLTRRTGVAVPPPVSLAIARDPGGYLSGLHLYRMGMLDPWVGWFADIVRRSGDATLAMVTAVRHQLTEWHTATADLRTDAAARALIDILPAHPVLHAEIAAQALRISERAARGALTELHRRGILEPFTFHAVTVGRPRQWWQAPALLDATTMWKPE